MSSPTLEPEPTATNMVWPFGENTTSRVRWPPPAGRCGTTISAGPRNQIAIAIGKANDGIGVADINPLRIWPPRIEGDAERAQQIGRKYARLRCVCAVRTQHANPPGRAFGDENVTVRRWAKEPRMLETGGKFADRKVGGNARLLSVMAYGSDPVADPLDGIGSGQILRADQAAGA